MLRHAIASIVAAVVVAGLSTAALARVYPGMPLPAAPHFAARGELDCNGYSPIQKPLQPHLPCADLSNYDNGHYVGHDETQIQFFSNNAGSASNLQWKIKLPVDRPLPSTQTFETEIAFWLGLAICDPRSYPLNACSASSDANPSGPNNPKAAGAAFLEFQFYPPGLPVAPESESCDSVHWCAAMGVFSLECSYGYKFCNHNCEEPLNYAYIQRDGVPTGPPGPADATYATFTPNGQTLRMSPGDELRITIKDSPAGLVNTIEDLTTGQSGYMIASIKNGFQDLDYKTCSPTPFAFHPMFSTANEKNLLPWSLGIRNVAYASEIGHFEAPDKDKDDSSCFNGPRVAGCEGADLDFDGPSYQLDWPDGTANTADPIHISSIPNNGVGPTSVMNGRYTAGYGKIRFVTGVPASESTCHYYTGRGCTIPPPGGKFYPFYGLSQNGGHCYLTLGNDIPGSTTDDFGGEKQWGTYDLDVYGTFQSKELANPCTPH